VKEKLLFMMNFVTQVKLSLSTSALNGGQWSRSRPSRFTPLQRTPVFIERKAWWAFEDFGPFWRTEKSSIPARIWIPYRPPLSLLFI